MGHPYDAVFYTAIAICGTMESPTASPPQKALVRVAMCPLKAILQRIEGDFGFDPAAFVVVSVVLLLSHVIWAQSMAVNTINVNFHHVRTTC